MAEDERLSTSEAPKPPNSTPNGPEKISSNPTESRNLKTAKEFISSVAARIADQPLQCFAPEVWGVLTAISEKARQRSQGLNMPLTCDEHCIGRLVDDTHFRITAPSVSANHCKIYRKKVASANTKLPSDNCCSVFLKDSSTNGTYLNWEKLNKSESEVKLCHGDIISIAVAPHHELAFAFVFREIQKSSVVNDRLLKRKPEELGAENKRLKGIGIGALDGPISLDDFRSLEKSNKELRKLLEDQVAITEALRSENRASTEKHESEMRELQESISKSFQSEFNMLNQHLEAKKKELAELNRTFTEQRHEMENLDKRLIASKQSCVEANEIIDSQKASMSELKTLLDKERDQRRGERDKAAADLKLSIHRIQAETAEEIRRVSDGALMREKEQQERINKLQDAEKERCSLVETLRSKLEDTRQRLVDSDNKVRQLEGQIHEELLASARSKKRVEEIEHDRKRLIKELEREKAAREEAWAKVSALELEIGAALRDLDFERRRLKGARERIMLRETQLRAFYSTTEEISVLFVKQQEQLKSMQRTLEDEENYETTSVDADLNPEYIHANRSLARNKETYEHNIIAKVGSGECHGHGRDQLESSSDEASMTEKHDCNVKSRGGVQDTEEVEITSDEHNVGGGFGSDINGNCKTPIFAGDAIGTEQFPETEAVGTSPTVEGDVAETEHVVETESQSLRRRMKFDLNKFSTSDDDGMLIDDEKNTEALDQAQSKSLDASPLFQSNSPLAVQNPMEDTEDGGSIKTGDLLASEVLGSWACSTAPSAHGENDSPRSRNDEEGTPLPVQDSNSLVAESQHIPSSKSDANASDAQNLMMLCEMISIISPDSKEQFSSAIIRDNQVGCDGIASSSETEDCGDKDEDVNAAVAGGVSDTETVGRNRAVANDEMEEDDDDDTQEGSFG
ncbi:uncharacterized protein [Henckelia pumila]|uniref:uncharacterized protein isoform X2 n=1 Tax=Henckelia pumila TaxID=405737 RepID=UPI003C6DE410